MKILELLIFEFWFFYTIDSRTVLGERGRSMGVELETTESGRPAKVDDSEIKKWTFWNRMTIHYRPGTVMQISWAKDRPLLRHRPFWTWLGSKTSVQTSFLQSWPWVVHQLAVIVDHMLATAWIKTSWSFHFFLSIFLSFVYPFRVLRTE